MHAGRILAFSAVLTLVISAFSLLPPSLFPDGGPLGPASAAPPPPDDMVDGLQYIEGDWTVSNTQSYTDEIIVLSGNLTIQNSAKLIFENVTLVMNCTTNGEYTLTVDGGQFFARNSTIEAADGDLHYKFLVSSGKMYLRWCTITDTFSPEITDIADLLEENLGGIEVRADNVDILDCTITDYSMVGINLKGSDATVHNCDITGNFIGDNFLTVGVLVQFNGLTGGASPDITGCNITGNTAGSGVLTLGSPVGFVTVDPLIDDCSISTNGVGVTAIFGEPEIGTLVRGNTIFANGVGAALLGSSGTLRGNNITLNLLAGAASSGFSLMGFGGGSDGDIEGNEIHNNLVLGLMVNGSSDPLVTENDISRNGVSGINVSEASPTIRDNTIENNLFVGISVEEADPEISDNDITVPSALFEGLRPRGYWNVNSTSGSFDDNDVVVGSNGIGAILQGINVGVEFQNNYFSVGEGALGVLVDGGRAEIQYNELVGEQNCVAIQLESTSSSVDGNIIELEDHSIGVKFLDSTGGISWNDITCDVDAGAIFWDNSAGSLDHNELIGDRYGTGAPGSSGLDFGIWINSSEGLNVIDNSVTGFHEGVQLVRTNDVWLRNNTVNENKVMDLHADRCEDMKIRTNTLGWTGSLVDNCSITGELDQPEGIITLLNTTTERDIEWLNVGSEGAVKVLWYYHITVKDVLDSPAEGVRVTTAPHRGFGQGPSPGTRLDRETPSNGKLNWQRMMEIYINNKGGGVGQFNWTEIISSYNVTADKAGYHPATETVPINASRHIILVMGPNLAPPKPINITPAETHNTTPLIRWDPVIDPDGDPVTYTLDIWDDVAKAGVPILEGAYANNATYVPLLPFEYGETYLVEVTAVDSYGLASPAGAGQIAVVNTPPEIVEVGGVAVNEGSGPVVVEGAVETPVAFDVKANDTDVDPVDTLTFSDDSDLFDVDPVNGTVEWVPGAVQWGNFSANITVSDGVGGTDTAHVRLHITTPNRPPVPVAGEDFVAMTGTEIVLNGTGSFDPDGTIERWEWECVSHTLDIEDGDSAEPSFDAAVDAVYVFSLRVRDDNRTWSPDRDIVTVITNAKGYLNQEPELVDGSVTPEEGFVNESFTFAVIYRDLDGDLPVDPGHIRVIVDDEVHNLTAVETDGNITLGVEYSVTIPGEDLGAGSDHTFRFEAFDGLDMATGDTVEHMGPVVKPLTLPDGAVDGGDGGGGDGNGSDGVDGGDGGEAPDGDKGSAGSNPLLWAAVALVIAAIIAVVLLMMFLRKKDKGADDGAPVPAPGAPGAGVAALGGAGGPPPAGPPGAPRPAGASAVPALAPAPVPQLPPAPKGGVEGAGVGEPQVEGGEDKGKGEDEKKEKPADNKVQMMPKEKAVEGVEGFVDDSSDFKGGETGAAPAGPGP